MALDFPNSPTDGQTFSSGSRTWVYTTATAVWTAVDMAEAYTQTVLIKTSSYTPILTDAQKVIMMDVASANNFTIPANTSVAFPVGTIFNVFQQGAGTTTFVPTTITTSAYSSGGAAAATTFVISATNANIAIGQLVTGTGFAENTLVTNIASTTITVDTAILSQVSGTITFKVGLVGTPGARTRTRWSSASLIKKSTPDGWVVFGDVML